jgi:hypothetical protein
MYTVGAVRGVMGFADMEPLCEISKKLLNKIAIKPEMVYPLEILPKKH